MGWAIVVPIAVVLGVLVGWGAVELYIWVRQNESTAEKGAKIAAGAAVGGLLGGVLAWWLTS